MDEIDLIYQTMFAELAQRTLDAQFRTDFPPHGRFASVPVKGRRYWYFDEGDKPRRYVGPADNPDIAARVEAFKGDKDDFRARRRMVSSLTREGRMHPPPRITGELVEALANAGLFRLRAVLVGTVAFGCYSGLLGVRLPSAAIMTGDADFAQDYAISGRVGDSLPPILDILNSVDPSFRAVPHQGDQVRSTAFINQRGYRAEFLTTHRGSDDVTGRPSRMPALGGASAEPLRYMDFLIRDPVRTVMLHGAGVSVTVPAPERFAVHKLIVASQRRNDGGGNAKRVKDLRQAALLAEAFGTLRRTDDLRYAFQEARDRGPSWETALDRGIAMLDEKGREHWLPALG